MKSVKRSHPVARACLTLTLAFTCFSNTAHAGLFDGLFKPRPKLEVQRPLPPASNTAGNGRYAKLASLGTWRLLSTAWTEQDELDYSNFVRAIGESDCRTVESCIQSEANPFRNSDPTAQEYTFWSDCADWPYFLRSYFAWKMGLPFMFSSGMSSNPLTAAQQADVDSGKEKVQDDIRYSKNGNRPGRLNRVPDPSQGSNFFNIQEMMQNAVATSTLRVDPRLTSAETYTPAIQAGAIRPGTIVYDPSGHTGVVYDITNDGQVMVFDAYSDKKSISKRRAYSTDFYKRSRINHGSWFQNFRPLVVEGARYDQRTGSFVGGTLRALSNAEIPDYSLEMFGNTTTADGKAAYEVDSARGMIVTSSFQEFLRRRLFLGPYQLDVLEEFKGKMNSVCEEFTSRADGVQKASDTGVAAKAHELTLPQTIYGGVGEWEVHSTPGGDVRRRLTVSTALNEAKSLMGHVKNKNEEYFYAGKNLKADIIAIANETLRTCAVSYRNSVGKSVRLNLDTMLRRAPLMSFSPWHCIELRWGATGDELKSCPDLNDSNKMRWYRAQQPLRNQMVRDTDIFTGFTLDQLEQNASAVGPAKAPNLNLIQRFEEEL